MVIAPENPPNLNESTPSSTVQKDDWQTYDEPQKIEFAQRKFEDARKCLAKNDIEAACDDIAICLEIRDGLFGEKGKELYEPLLLNARILLEQGRLEAGVITNAVEGLENIPVDEEDEEKANENYDKIEGEKLTAQEQEEVAEKVDAALNENAELIENKQALPAEEEASVEESKTAPAENEKNGDDVEEDEENEDNESLEEATQNDETNIDELSSYQLAYENAATARLIAEIYANEATANSDDFMLWHSRVCDALLLLGEVSIADENYEIAIDDLSTAEAKQRTILSADDRRIAETYFQMGRCYTQWNKYDMAAEVYRKSMAVIALLKENQEKELATAKDDDLNNLKIEIDKLGALIQDIESWVKDSVDSHLNKQQFDEARTVDNENTSPKSNIQDNEGQVKEIAVRKRKPSTDGVSQTKEAPNEQTCEVAAKKAKLALGKTDDNIEQENDVSA